MRRAPPPRIPLPSPLLWLARRLRRWARVAADGASHLLRVLRRFLAQWRARRRNNTETDHP